MNDTDPATPLESLRYLFEQFLMWNRNDLNWREVRDLMPRMRVIIERFEAEAASPPACKHAVHGHGSTPQGCVCPPRSEETCKAMLCPRRAIVPISVAAA